ncbi:MAG: hypothetical protein US31_C0005G0040 [Berkelbacteria bacterium GW2011_GWA1_36_9]|uniref:Uncharacterized protein n=1 Tax=Berkelbacteria bacterium GW2011_GWA1_36_9 TaxID=1618331 RepID=A0A0G0FX19_9BACT|nr:MAG: hypothetical protein US31_C0005G0040 [Berkelbacteria bacterium GW2011_GWA1_36_9]
MNLKEKNSETYSSAEIPSAWHNTLVQTGLKDILLKLHKFISGT